MQKNSKTSKTTRLAAALLTAALMVGGTAFAATQSGTSAYAATSTPLYQSDYDSKAEAVQAGLDLNEKIAEEGMILVKNNNDALPLVTGKGTAGSKITVLGYAGVAPNAGSSQNGGDSSAGAAIAQEDVYSSLEEAGYQLNPAVKAQYQKWVEEKLTSDLAIDAQFDTASAAWADSVKKYNDAAIVVLSRGSGTIDATNEDSRTHVLQLDQEQYDLIDYAKTISDKVIVLINSCTPLEISAIQNDAGVDAVLLIGEPGDNGFAALGKVLSGEVNPSGRTTDTWAVDFTANPSYQYFNTQTDTYAWGTDGEGTNTGYTRYKYNGEEINTWEVGYVEGIYVGYRYYETRAYEETQANPDSTWWEDNVTYTFGYGMSYTTFDWEITPATASGTAIGKNDTLKFNVKVTNTGDYSGKEVVQLYYTAPYTAGGIEKAYVNLGDYAKTKELAPGESQTVQLTVDVSDMASYDYKTDKTYVLDAGTYNIKIAKNAHDYEGNYNYVIGEKQLCDISSTGYEITNQLDDVTAGFETLYADDALSRENLGKTLSGPEHTRDITEAEYDALAYEAEDYLGYYDVALEDLEYETDAANRTSEQYEMTLFDLIGADADDPRYQELVEQLTLDELAMLINNGGFACEDIYYIGLPYAHNTDGPKGWTGTGVDSGDRFNYFTSEPMIASTFNKEIAYEMGKIIGEQGLWGNSTQESGVAYNYTGWYSPGMNIHRSPFDSRYTEYYSEDPVLTGYTAANISIGADEKGCYITMKHFAFHNDGGGAFSYRAGPIDMQASESPSTPYDGLCAWMTEQAAREIYLKAYQIAVEEGHADYMMSSFTRIGSTWCGGSYAVNTEILRNEWGFEGSAVTDIVFYNMCNAYQYVLAGGGTMLDSGFLRGCGIFIDVAEVNAMPDDEKAAVISAMQETARQILYMVSHSNAMQTPAGAKVVYSGLTENADGEEVAITFADATVGVAYTASPAVNTASINTYYAYSDVTYTVTGLPEGMSYDAASGKVVGTPTRAGTYTVTVTASADGYQSASVDYMFVVNAAQDFITSDEVQDMIDSSVSEIETPEAANLGGVYAVAIVSCVVAVASLALALYLAIKKKGN